MGKRHCKGSKYVRPLISNEITATDGQYNIGSHVRNAYYKIRIYYQISRENMKHINPPNMNSIFKLCHFSPPPRSLFEFAEYSRQKILKFF
jgi:hypothetical protein